MSDRPQSDGSGAATETNEEERKLLHAVAEALTRPQPPAGERDQGKLDLAGHKRFQIVRPVGEGGMGVVFEALDHGRRTRVALKTLRRISAEALDLFKNEFRSLQDVQHRNLVHLGELIEYRGQWFFTMELIEGEGFWDHVRPKSPAGACDDAAPFDEARLRAALGQLGVGLRALHDAGKVHRDVKPSNVRVTPEGRVILLDFGLVTDADRDDAGGGGTVEYMAPEQAAVRPVVAAADWYAVGVMLYEALTGRLPFVGTRFEIRTNKQRHEPPAPRAIVAPAESARIPADLDALCVDLLRIDPALRPTADEILRRLGVDVERDRDAAAGASLPRLFVGRSVEIAALRALYDRSRQGEAVLCHVHGESGVGKSALVRRFVRDLEAEEPAPLVLAGRCYPRESVPYKAFDGVVDALSRHLRRLPRSAAAALLPDRPSILAKVFPVLGRIEALAELPSGEADTLDPRENRRRAFAALRGLFTRIADRQPLVVVIDDLQWADADSLALLRELMHPPGAPALLLLATVRLPEGEWRRALAASGEPAAAHVHHLSLGPLSPDEARDLASRLAAELAPERRIDVASLAEEANGQPLFVEELVRHLAASGEAPVEHAGTEGARAVVRLDEALWSRIARLPEATRRLLELVMIAAGPTSQDVLAAAASVEPFQLLRQASTLRAAHLVCQGGAGADLTIEPLHDRMRDAVVARLDEDAQRRNHLALGQAHEAAGGGDLDALAVHWHAAGDLQRTARYSVAAAEKAAAALAFDRAAALYRRAAEVVSAGAPAEGRALHVKHGDMLRNAGRGAEAARVHLMAAEGAGAEEALRLRRDAAHLLLITGHIHEGGAMLEALLASEGIAVPHARWRAVARIVYRRLELSVRGISFEVRDAGKVAPRDLARIDMCWAVAVGLSLVDPLRGRALQSDALRFALRAGEPYRVASLLALEACYRAAEDGGAGLAQQESLLETSRRLADRAGNPLAAIFLASSRASTSFFTGRFRQSLDAALATEEMWRRRGTGVGWTLATCALWETRSLHWLGRMAELAARVPEFVREFEARGDLYGATNLRTAVAPFVHLAAGDPGAGRQEVEDALRRWQVAGFRFQHLSELLFSVAADLYEGKGNEAWARLREKWPEVERAGLLRVRLFRIEAWYARGCAALSAAARGADRALRIREAERSAAVVAREEMPWSSALGRMLLAGAAAARGDEARAASLYAAAARGFDLADLGLHAAVARRRRGALIGGGAGRALVAEADAWMGGQKIQDPARMAATIAPPGAASGG